MHSGSFIILDLKTHIPQKQHCDYEESTHSYFAQVDAIIQRVPGALLVVRPPRLLEDLADALAFLAFVPVSPGDARCPRDAIGPGVTVPARGACWALHAAAELEQQGGEEVKVKPIKQHQQSPLLLLYHTSCVSFSFVLPRGLNLCLGCMLRRRPNAAIRPTITHKQPDYTSFTSHINKHIAIRLN